MLSFVQEDPGAKRSLGYVIYVHGPVKKCSVISPQQQENESEMDQAQFAIYGDLEKWINVYLQCVLSNPRPRPWFRPKEKGNTRSIDMHIRLFPSLFFTFLSH